MANTRWVSRVFVGRRGEFGRIAEAFGEAAGGASRTVLIGGEAGIGKSRLVDEFIDSVGPKPSILRGGCIELGAGGLPYGPFVAALRGLSAGRAAVDLEGLLGTGVAGLAPLLPGLGGMTRRGRHDDTRPRLFESVLTLLFRLIESGPVLVVIEDAHWADRSSLDLLEFLVRNQHATAGSMIVVTYRSDEVPRRHPLRGLLAELDRVPWVERLELPRMSRAEVADMVKAILDTESDPGLVGRIFERSGGNPLFVEALLASGTGWPASLEDLVLARVHRLQPVAEQLVRDAAAGGVRISHPLLAAVFNGDHRELSDAVRSAVDAGVLETDGEDYSFRHSIYRDAVYHDLLPGERADLHARYAGVLAEQPELAAGDLAGSELANHRFAAGDVIGGVQAAWSAAAEAGRASAYAEQLELLQRVLDSWHALPGVENVIGVDHAVVLIQAVEAASLAGEHVRGEQLATAGLGEIDAEHERVRAALLLEQRGRMRAQLARPGSLEDGREALRILPADHPARAFLLNSMAERLLEIPLAEEARSTAEAAVTAAGEVGDESSEAAALVTLAVLDARRGDLDGQLPLLHRAQAIAAGTGDDRLLLRALFSESHLMHAYGRLDRAVALAKDGMAAAHRAGLARTVGTQHAVGFVDVLISAGRWDEAVESADHALEQIPPAGLDAHLRCLKGYVALHRGALEQTENAVDRARELLAEAAPSSLHPLVLAALEAELRLAQNRPADAIAVVEVGLAAPSVVDASRFTWPLLVIGARAAGDVGDDRGAKLLTALRELASKLPAPTAVQAAHALTFAAEAAEAAGEPDQDAWGAAAAAWAQLAHPLPHAQSSLAAAETMLAGGGDRTRAAAHLRRADELATGLGATTLRERIDELARRARITLAGRKQERSDDPIERARARLGLTPRETEILRLVTDGRSNQEIADELFISPKTASVHVSNILAKLGVANRVEAAATANRLGLFA